MITGFSTSPGYLNYASTPKATTAQLIATADAKSVDAAKLPGTSARAQSLIDSLIKTNAGAGKASKALRPSSSTTRVPCRD